MNQSIHQFLLWKTSRPVTVCVLCFPSLSQQDTDQGWKELGVGEMAGPL